MSKIFKILEYLIPVIVWIFERSVKKVAESRDHKKQMKAIEDMRKKDAEDQKKEEQKKELDKAIKDLARAKTQNAIKFGRDHR